MVTPFEDHDWEVIDGAIFCFKLAKDFMFFWVISRIWKMNIIEAMIKNMLENIIPFLFNGL